MESNQSIAATAISLYAEKAALNSIAVDVGVDKRSIAAEQVVNKDGVAANHTSGGDVRARNFRRATDDQTAGGNAYTGNTGNVNGGEIYNEADDDSTITNTGGSK